MVTMTRDRESIAPTTCLLMAFELGQRSWKLGFSTGIGQRPRVRQIPAGAVGVIANEIVRAKMRLGLPADASVISCYEAGRDGFWLHGSLAQGITKYVVDCRALK
jgi:transposase